MYVYEFEAKNILQRHAVATPETLGLYTEEDVTLQGVSYPCAAKVQEIEGKRGKRGHVEIVASYEALKRFYETIQMEGGASQRAGILVEEFIEAAGDDLYVSIAYRSKERGPVLFVGRHGGTDIEETEQALFSFPIHTRTPQGPDAIILQKELALSPEYAQALSCTLEKCIACFLNEDCTLLEINPLRAVQKGDGYDYCALDAKMILDDRALFRHTERTFAPSLMRTGRTQTEREKAVEEINRREGYSGTPCRYVERNGDVALLLSGGGASMAIFDRVVAGGITPGNYSEYSGNPNKEKVEALTRVVLEKPGQTGLLVAGAIANFTRIDETMAGVVQALTEEKPPYPIVIRRGGPGEREGKVLVETCAREHALDITWFGSETPLMVAVDFFIGKQKAYAHALSRNN